MLGIFCLPVWCLRGVKFATSLLPVAQYHRGDAHQMYDIGLLDNFDFLRDTSLFSF